MNKPDSKHNKGTDPSGVEVNIGSPGEGRSSTNSNTNKTKDDGLSGKAEQEQIADQNKDIPGHDNEDKADLDSLKGIVERDENGPKEDQP